MIDMVDILNAAAGLASGRNPRNLRYALQIGAFSANRSVRMNVRAARVLSLFVRDGLPDDSEALYQMLRRAAVGQVYTKTVDACYWVEMLDNFGALEPYKQTPRDYAGWVAWRDGLRALCAGHGLGLKTISFAGLLYAPLDCELVPVDIWVCRRLGLTTRAGAARATCRASKRIYEGVEGLLQAERAQSPYPSVALGLWHWLQWERYRVQMGASDRYGDGLEVHSGLSCCQWRG